MPKDQETELREAGVVREAEYAISRILRQLENDTEKRVEMVEVDMRNFVRLDTSIMLEDETGR